MFVEILRRRRSTRKYKSTSIEREKMDILIETLLRAPSSRGLSPWDFIFVTEAELIQSLSRTKSHGSSFLSGAPLVVAVCADPSKCDVWVEDCSIAAILLQVAAESLGLGSCWSQIRKRFTADGRSAEEHVRDLLNLPPSYRVEALIGIGYPATSQKGHPLSELPSSKIHFNRFGEG